MDKIILNFFLLTISLELLYLLLFLLTIRIQNFRFWPPPGPRSWQFFVSWFLAGTVTVFFLFLGLLDFDSAILPPLIHRLFFALVCFVPGTLLGTWAYLQFGLRNTIGLGDSLVTDGPYRFSRNPQYLGDCLNILGFMVLTNSWMAWAIGGLGIILNLLAPHTEEPWLVEKFGNDYLVYKKRVPRFIGRIIKKNST